MSDKNKPYWAIDDDTNEILEKNLAQYRGGIYHHPKKALFTEPLASKEGFAVIAIFSDAGEAIDSEYIEDNRDKTIYNELNCQNSKVVDYLGPIEKGWTSDEPSTLFDERIASMWVTNLQKKYEAEHAQVDAIRKALYTESVSPLLEESRIKLLQGKPDEANELEQSALVERERIQSENPWPEQPAI